MAGNAHSELKKHLDKTLGGAGWTDDFAPTLTTATLSAHQLSELFRVARAMGYDLSITAGVLKLTPR